jgi:hypothetical protein
VCQSKHIVMICGAHDGIHTSHSKASYYGGILAFKNMSASHIIGCNITIPKDLPSLWGVPMSSMWYFMAFHLNFPSVPNWMNEQVVGESATCKPAAKSKSVSQSSRKQILTRFFVIIRESNLGDVTESIKTSVRISLSHRNPVAVLKGPITIGKSYNPIKRHWLHVDDHFVNSKPFHLPQ